MSQAAIIAEEGAASSSNETVVREDTPENTFVANTRAEQQIFHLNRRLSGMPLLPQFGKDYPHLDESTTNKLDSLLDTFPLPPTVNPQQVQTPASSTQTQQGLPRTSSGWGSIRGIAEKFNVFSKSS
mmetsp:Transcript_4363/g.7069  ORF Transcript_4363/g.7069 Transcript_4363/m.7069 type:complete len:127 (+) Transcript_4363:1275-1655(+)